MQRHAMHLITKCPTQHTSSCVGHAVILAQLGMRPRHHCVQHWRNLLSALGSVHPNTAGCLCGWEPWPNNRHVYTRPRAGSFAMAQHSPTSLSPTRTTFLATWLSAGTTPHSEPYMFLTHACDPVRTRSCTVYHAPLRVNAVGADRQGWRRACVCMCACVHVCARAQQCVCLHL